MEMAGWLSGFIKKVFLIGVGRSCPENAGNKEC
jgi:hypothetical protein